MPGIRKEYIICKAYLYMKNICFFIFDFLISMSLGIITGLSIKYSVIRQKSDWVAASHVIGSFSLNGFIVYMILSCASLLLMEWSWEIAGLLFIKWLFISAVFIIVSKLIVKNHEQSVLISACWAFTLSAPSACMNALNSVISKHGEAEEVVLIIPPVILWLVNYPHYMLFQFLYK